MAKRQARGAVILQDIAVPEANKLRQRLENPVLDEKTGKLVECNLTANEIARLYEIGTVAERRARGEGDEDRLRRMPSTRNFRRTPKSANQADSGVLSPVSLL